MQDPESAKKMRENDKLRKRRQREMKKQEERKARQDATLAELRDEQLTIPTNKPLLSEQSI